ncbi:MAG: DUF2157 domain-containing protein, partial [Clostridia bacterium]|nr:DUF2157 domain-containing protein [Clostridia bacterium]
AARTFIAFLPLIASQALVFYVYRHKMESVAFREGAAILNMAGVFASIAIVSQIFHLSGDFTRYILVCGVLSFPSMLVMNAVAPLAIYFWTVLNGGPFLDYEHALSITVILFVIGAVYAVCNFKAENGKAEYLSWISVIGAFILMLITIAVNDADWLLMFLVFFAFLLSVSKLWNRAGVPLAAVGGGGLLVMLAISTYRWCWEHEADWDNTVAIAVLIAMVIPFAVLSAKAIKEKSTDIFTYVCPAIIVLRLVWGCFGLNGELFGWIFSIIFNVLMFAIGVVFIAHGVKNTNIFWANTGMATVCVLIILRFFDSEISLGLRGLVFLLVGIGFLIFNVCLVRDKKAKERGI